MLNLCFRLLALLVLLPGLGRAQGPGTVVLPSKAMGEDRTIFIHMPPGYEQSSDAYPVLYLLDGDIHFKYTSELVEFLADMERVRIPEMIVVGISSDNRLSDFTPVHSLEIDGRIDSGLSATGNGGAFLRYIRDELVPYMDGHYRTQPYRILAAHSLGGLFALYAKEASPELFASEILMSPAFYGGNKKILTDFPEFLRAHPQLVGNMYLTIGDEPGAKGRVDTLADDLKGSAPVGFRWKYVSYPGEDHFSLPYKSMYDGLKFIYADWFFNVWDNDHLPSLVDLQKHFSMLSHEFGYTMGPSEDMINSMAYRQLRAGHIDLAIELFKDNIKTHPHSFNVYDSMGDAYRIKGEKALAIEYYKRSLELNPNNENGKEQLKRYGVK